MSETTENPGGWKQVVLLSQLQPGMQCVQVDRRKVVIAKVGEEIFAYSNLCPHSGGPMNRGELNDAVVTCPLHGWRFDLKKEGAETHGYRPLKTYPTREESGNLLILI
ncbi:MAG: ferredoxin, 2Fe-2S [Betaproteobacteria bacterium]|nr:ferredoxin, 2Fe-2S [Betaproteobacteria bacterium]